LVGLWFNEERSIVLGKPVAGGFPAVQILAIKQENKLSVLRQKGSQKENGEDPEMIYVHGVISLITLALLS
jgi:hypothetical protein